MEQSKIQEIKLNWGDRNCHHPEIAEETCFGRKTGNVVCTTCGRTIYSFNSDQESPLS